MFHASAIRIRIRIRWSIIALLVSAIAVRPEAATAYYLDAASANTVQDGRSPSTAWTRLAQVNARTFAPGDVIALKRGTVYAGTLQPGGSGAAGSPITLTAYGSGARPRIDGGPQMAAVRLFNQQHWHVESLEVIGGSQYGVYISGDQPGALTHFRVTDLVVHDAYSTPRWDSGLVVIIPFGAGVHLHDVIVDGVTAYNSNLWFGIHVGFNFWSGDPVPELRNSDVIVRNCTVHDVYGDAITVADTNRALIERNVGYRCGLAPAGISYTPNMMWSWSSDSVTLQFNEAYEMSSFGGGDGGAFDVDWGSTNTLIQYNYAHDNQRFGAVVYGLQGKPTINSVIRYNVFSHNRDTEIMLYTADGGTIDGVQIYGNTISTDRTVLWAPDIARSGSGAFRFSNNIVRSSSSTLLNVSGSYLRIDSNLGWSTSGSANWQSAWGMYSDPKLVDPTYQSVGMPTTAFTLMNDSPAIAAGVVLPNMGARDFFGNAVPAAGPITIGAHQATASPPPPPPSSLVRNPGFEDDGAGVQAISGWSTWAGSAGTDADADYSESYGGAHGGTFHGTHWRNSAYEVYTYQVVTGLTNGTYTLSAWVKGSGGQTYGWMEAKDFGGTKLTANIPATSTWTQLTIGGVQVTNGQCVIGFYSRAGAGQWIYFDDIQFASSSGSVNAAPTIAIAAAATPALVTGTSTMLSVLGADDGGEAALVYTWSVVGAAPAPLTFSQNGTNAAKSATVTVAKAGSYVVSVTVRDAQGATITSTVTISVTQTLTTVTVTPATVRVGTSATSQFIASGRDQFTDAMSAQPAFAWQVSGGGTISTSGLFTAGSSAGGPFTVTVSAGGRNGSASVTVIASAPANILVNPGFEADGAPVQAISAWGTWGGNTGVDSDADYTESFGGTHGGSWHGTHWKPTAYEVYTWQVPTGLASGTYTLSAWVKGSGGQQYAWLEAKDYGGAKRTVDIPGTSAWTLISIPGIQVTNGQCVIGFYSRASAGQWIHFDDLSFAATGAGAGAAASLAETTGSAAAGGDRGCGLGGGIALVLIGLAASRRRGRASAV
ncbi:MAG: right-handed parallel beta-helix repeat-containing protein [Planctomycetes bacterium]|nr:right-handed parallel beta-helix repeat-containing protein [Planctomycetota bacterium]